MTPSPSAPSALVPLLTQSWPRPLLALGGGLLATEALAELLHLPSSTLVGGGVLAGGCWLLSRRSRRLKPRLPSSMAGWTERCERVLEQFTQLASAEQGDGSIDQRRGELRALLEAEAGRPLALALAGSQPPAPHLQTVFQQALQGPRRLRLHWGQPLPAWSDDWRWGGLYEGCDVLLFHLRMPLRASDLRWLESLPADQPLWLLLEADAALVTSGTATLETALFGVPQVVCYKGNPLSYQIAKRLVKVKYISLVNLIMDREVVKELIQDALTPENLSRELSAILEPAVAERMRSDYAGLRGRLTKGGDASARAAACIVETASAG